MVKSSLIKLTLSLGLIWLWLSLVDVRLMLGLLGQLQPLWLGLALITAMVNFGFSTLRLKSILALEWPVAFGYLLRINLIGAVTSLVIPVNAGGLARGWLLKKKLATTFSRVFGYLLLDFLLSCGLTLLLALMIMVAWFLQTETFFLNWPFWLTACLLVVLTGAILVKPDWWLGLIGLVVRSAQFKQRLNNLAAAFIELRRRPGRLLLVLGLTGAILVLAGVSFWFVLLAFGLKISLPLVVAANILLIGVNLIPATPAKIGQYELVGSLILPWFLKIDKTVAAGAVLVEHVLMISLFLGLAGLFLSAKSAKL